MDNKALIDKLNQQKHLTKEEFVSLLSSFDENDRAYAAEMARAIAERSFGKKIYIRGIIEFSNYCKNDCYYCGIRKSNKNASRYRLSKEDILFCCQRGYELGFRTFVLQSGEDPYYTDEIMVDIISTIRNTYADCAITISIGEKSRESYEKYFAAGANRFLLRHETANADHYARLHPSELSFDQRFSCLYELKEIGFQTGCGCMVGAPFQTMENLAEDLLFMADFKPQMIGTGPFIPHKDTPFRDFPAGSADMTLFLLSLCRIMLPFVLLPATTALGTISGEGRQQGVLAGANVIMPNLSPPEVRSKYLLYDNKAFVGDDAAESVEILKEHMAQIGYQVVIERGDYQER